ncbi:ATP-binding cassette domain-containing protein [Christiangramia sp.]|uniref:ATP-binding cassette domain-containing protein n=1 Tax=Christiangramia sp. TaxID=1931228 RepID=UPI002605B009|nr:ATP-binding cassette domain-containing protein [Christiangramia sp.]
MNKLHVDSIRKFYNNRLILSDIFLSCNQGKTIGLIGRNGSGKSTLLKIIFGVENAENKYVRIGEKILKNVGDSRNLINYLPQENFLPGEIKVKNLIGLFLPKERRVQLINNKFINPLLQKKFQVLSGGEKRILEILLLLYSKAEFILLDEPFEGVSPIVRDFILESINKEKNRKGFIITDHDYENVIKVADKILFLENGCLKEIKDKKDLFERGYLPNTPYHTG